MKKIIISAKEVLKIQLKAEKRILMGNEFKNHSAAKAKIHKNKKKVNKRLNSKEKRDLYED